MWNCNKIPQFLKAALVEQGKAIVGANTLEGYDFGFLTTPLTVAIWYHTEHISSFHTHFDAIHVEVYSGR